MPRGRTGHLLRLQETRVQRVQDQPHRLCRDTRQRAVVTHGRPQEDRRGRVPHVGHQARRRLAPARPDGQEPPHRGVPLGQGLHQAPQGRQQHLVLRHRGLSDRGFDPILHRPGQPHQNPQCSRTGEVHSVIRQGQPAKIK